MIKKIKFLHILTATLIIDMIFLFIFKIFDGKEKWISINNWYDNLKWTAVLLDVLSIMIGFYLAKFIYKYFLKNNYINKNNEFMKFLLIVLTVQIIHDFCFYFFVIKPFPFGKNKIIDEFKDYANIVGINAVIGDSLMYIIATPLLYYFIVNNPDNINTFISIVCTYLVGYLLYQKPLYI